VSADHLKEIERGLRLKKMDKDNYNHGAIIFWENRSFGELHSAS
jgi:hypothetical protein